MKTTKQLSRGLCKVLISAFLFLFMTSAIAQPLLPFTKGVNMITWFETFQPGIPNLNKYDETDFAMLKSMGVEIVRLPVHFDLVMEPLNTGVINELVLEKLDQVCDWAEKYQIYLVIDNHSFNSEEWDNNPPTAKLYKENLEAVWSQIAPRYKSRSEYIIYEIMNEPKAQGEIPAKWIKIQQDIIDFIRTYDTKHAIVVSGADHSSPDALIKMKPYKDPNLIYTCHFYDPMLFTHQGATWIGGGFSETTGIPFPYDKSRMPNLSSSAKNNSWLVEMYNHYSQIGSEKYIKERIKKIADWAKKNKVRVWAGEMGTNYWTASSDRIAWLNTVTSALKENNIPYCSWGIDGSSGFLKFGSRESFPEDIEEEILRAYGFSMPDESIAKARYKYFPQKPYIVYDGLAGDGTIIGWRYNTTLVKADDTHQYCEKTESLKDGGLSLKLPVSIISKVAEYHNNLVLSFSVKFADKNQTFTVSLRDTDGGSELPPWSNAAFIKASDYKIGEWVTVDIPLSKMNEEPGWSDKEQKQFSPQGKFDWNRVESIYFNFWHETDQKGDIYIDDVVIKRK